MLALGRLGPRDLPPSPLDPPSLPEGGKWVTPHFLGPYFHLHAFIGLGHLVSPLNMELLARKVADAVPFLKWQTWTPPTCDPGSVGAQRSPTNSTIQWTYYCVSHTCAFNFSSDHIFILKEKWAKLILA